MPKRLPLILCFAYIFLYIQSSFGDVSRSGVLFLLIEPDARAGAMGGASVALTNDAMATHYNPAGITGVKRVSGEMGHYQWLPDLAGDLDYTYLCGAMNLGEYGYVGLAFKYLSLGRNVRTDEYGQALGMFESHETAIGASYALELTDDLSAGWSLKFIYSRLSQIGAGLERGKGTGRSLALDFGIVRRRLLPNSALIKTPYRSRPSESSTDGRIRGFSVGLAITNIGPDISYEDIATADPLPRELRIGGAYRAVDTDPVGMNLAVDYCKELVGVTENFLKEYLDPKGGVILKFGAELTLPYFLTARCGYHYDEEGDTKDLTWGFGIGPEWARVDISLGSPLGTTRYSLKFDYPASRR